MSQDIYRELASIRAHSRYQTFFQAWQTGLLADMDASMHSIHATMADVRQLHADGLAAQQAMLQREAFQDELEEFIYKMEKLVAECQNPSAKLPPSTRYFTLLSYYERIKQDNITTPIIRGRDNKAAFDRVVGEIKSLAAALKKDPEVQEAIRWAQAEQKRLAHEQKKIAAKRRVELTSELTKLESKASSLSAELQTGKNLTFDVWIERRLSSEHRRSFVVRAVAPASAFALIFLLMPKNPDGPPPPAPMWAMACGEFVFVVLVIAGCWYWIDRSSSGSSLSRIERKLDSTRSQIAAIKAELAGLPN